MPLSLSDRPCWGAKMEPIADNSVGTEFNGALATVNTTLHGNPGSFWTAMTCTRPWQGSMNYPWLRLPDVGGHGKDKSRDPSGQVRFQDPRCRVANCLAWLKSRVSNAFFHLPR